MMRSFPIGGGLACALILCGGSVAAERGAPAVNPGYDWAIRISEDRVSSAILAYEVADTDDQPLNFACEQGGNRIFAGISGGDPRLAKIVLASGDQTLTLAGKSEGGEEEMPYFTSREIAGGSPFIHAFAANGWLRMTAGGATIDMVGTAAGKRAIRRFVQFCTGG